MLFLPDFDPIRGTAIFRTLRRWPNRIIPYDISAITDANDRITITKAMNQLIFDVGKPIETQTGDKKILEIQYGNGCSAPKLNLFDIFFLDFCHKESRPDRESHIKIRAENILTNQEHNFKKYA
ncbi:unnamed protein product [Rotaria sordida]|uniref:Peptidase M12A domain-containing protein n=1 Tax=Rotaria sordida TaxID=392033 RepID=A0A818J5Y4_9BILA|nr:unnamed protein product [Rotaria sordida]